MSRTASQLRTQARRLDRVYLQMAKLVCIMRDEAALCLQFRASGPVWWLTNGRQVPESIALRVTVSPALRYFELFSRSGRRERWDMHGDEVGKLAPRERRGGDSSAVEMPEPCSRGGGGSHERSEA